MSYPVLQQCTAEFLYGFLREEILPIVRGALEVAEAAQRIRVTTLPGPVMDELCEALQGEDRWVARVLVAGSASRPWEATATKIIELRNVLEKPLVVFIPPGLRTAAEDSLDIATFRELSLSSSVTGTLITSLLGKMPGPLSTIVSAVLEQVRREKWARNEDELVTYLLTVILNGSTAQAVGGALYVFGLIPHFGLSEQTNIPYWVSRNHKMQQVLSDLRQPVQARISWLPLQPNTIQPKIFAFLRSQVAQDQDPRLWCAQIARSQHDLALDNWPFIESADDTQLRIKLEPLLLPMQSADDVSGTTALPVLNLDGRDGVKVSFRAIPAPQEVPAWKTYRIQILLVDGDQPTVAWESNGYKKLASRQKANRTIKIGDLQGLDEGTYFLRVDAYDQEGAVLTQPKPLDSKDESGRKENESEYFLVVRDGVEVVAAPPRAIDLPSFGNCWIEANIRTGGSVTEEDQVASRQTVTGSWAEPTGAAVRGEAHFKLEGEGLAGFTVVVPSFLRKLELANLENPDHFGRYYLVLSDVRSATDIEIKRASGEAPGGGVELDRFLESRRLVFSGILNQHRSRLADKAEDATCRSLIETADLLALTESISEYGRRYDALLEKCLCESSASKEKSALFRFLGSLDVTELRWRARPGDPGRALLLAPTHPLRLLWHLQHSTLCESALQSWKDQTAVVQSWPSFLRQLVNELLPINLPMVIFGRRGRAYVEQGLLSTHWPLYLPDRSENAIQIDNAAARDTCRHLLGIRRPAPVTAAVSSYEIAGRAFEYLQRHPYVEQLKLNVFNPGDGQLITEALRIIESLRQRIHGLNGPPTLRYSVQMFGSRSQVETMGDAFESLLDPERQVGDDDEFTLMSSNHLLPKLVFARNSIEDFRERPQEFAAHLTVLIEQFGSQARLARVEQMRRGCFVGGLVLEPETSLGSQDAGFGWYKGLRATTGASPSEVEGLLTQAVWNTQRLQAASAAGERTSPEVAPVLSLHLDTEGQSLLLLIHTFSDWVLTIDRNLGLDYFDSPSPSQEAGYLLDYAPEFLQEDRHRILLTTRSTFELQAVIRPAIERFGLALPSGREPVILETLRSLSGRLALKLLSSDTHSAEVVGLLLAKWLMEQSGLLRDRVAIPLDAHRGWFRTDEENSGEGRRADLLLVTLDRPRRVIKCSVVEVKLREELTASGRSALYREMHEQAEASERRLRELFDPNLYPQPRADFVMRAKEFTTALSFYLKRAARYGLFQIDELSEALQFVDSLDGGYALDLASFGVVFERKAHGSHIDEDEPGFVVHRFGSDVAKRLLAKTCGDASPSMESSQSSDSGSTPASTAPNAVPGIRDDITDSLIHSFASNAEGTDAIVSAVGQIPVKKLSRPEQINRIKSRVDDRPEQDKVHIGAASEVLPTGTPLSVPELEAPITGGAESPASNETSVDGSSAIQPVDLSKLTDSPITLVPGVLLGSNEITPQFGIVGRLAETSVTLDLTGCNTISLFGVQGFGKSYTLGVIAEMATTPVQGINVLPSPLATVIFHYHKSDAYAPEFASARAPNHKVREIDRLFNEYGARPHALNDVLLLTPEAKVQERREEFPNLEVQPIKFSSGELGAESWKLLLGAYGNDSLYIRQLVAIMRRHRENLTLQTFRDELLRSAELSAQARKLAEDRLGLAEPYVDDTSRLGDLIRPGRTIIVDLRDPWIERDEALGLFVVMMRIFASTKYDGHSFNKLVIFDEAHKYISESELIAQVVETIREMRHQATSIVIASQDPLSVPRSVIELTSVLFLHRMTSPQWLRHLKGAISALDGITEAHLSTLQAGEALVWAQRSTDKRFTQRPYKIQIRPRFTLHGGGTKTAVAGATVK